MAEYGANQREHDAAIRLYKEALDYMPDDASTLLALAKLYLQVGCSVYSKLWKDLQVSRILQNRRERYSTTYNRSVHGSSVKDFIVVW